MKKMTEKTPDLVEFVKLYGDIKLYPFQEEIIRFLESKAKDGKLPVFHSTKKMQPNKFFELAKNERT